jgi:hypothetical protein
LSHRDIWLNVSAVFIWTLGEKVLRFPHYRSPL